uniref:TIL domain-containing protein n=1 Tax=Rhipicephalus microplus TaxID=6941 RepID=A0A6M2D4W7_RHIMP
MAGKITLLFFFIIVINAFLKNVKAHQETALHAPARQGIHPFWNQTQHLRPRPPSKQCQRNEEYKKCVSGSCREGRCNYLRKGWPDACTLDCVSGCFCKRGYFRNYRRKCVLGYRCFQEIIPYGSKLQE